MPPEQSLQEIDQKISRLAAERRGIFRITDECLNQENWRRDTHHNVQLRCGIDEIDAGD